MTGKPPTERDRVGGGGGDLDRDPGEAGHPGQRFDVGRGRGQPVDAGGGPAVGERHDARAGSPRSPRRGPRSRRGSRRCGPSDRRTGPAGHSRRGCMSSAGSAWLSRSIEFVWRSSRRLTSTRPAAAGRRCQASNWSTSSAGARSRTPRGSRCGISQPGPGVSGRGDPGRGGHERRPTAPGNGRRRPARSASSVCGLGVGEAGQAEAPAEPGEDPPHRRPPRMGRDGGRAVLGEGEREGEVEERRQVGPLQLAGDRKDVGRHRRRLGGSDVAHGQDVEGGEGAPEPIGVRQGGQGVPAEDEQRPQRPGVDLVGQGGAGKLAVGGPEVRAAGRGRPPVRGRGRVTRRSS